MNFRSEANNFLTKCCEKPFRFLPCFPVLCDRAFGRQNWNRTEQVRLQPFQEMSLLHPCCRVQSITQEQILDDWDFYSARLVDRIMHEIFENMDENAFNLEYVWLVDRRLRATLSIYKGIPNPTYKGIPYPTYKGIP